MKNRILFGNEPDLSEWQRRRIREIRGNNVFGFNDRHIQRMQRILSQFPLEIIARDNKIPKGIIIMPHLVVHTPQGYLTYTLLVPIVHFQNYEINPVEKIVEDNTEIRYVIFSQPSFERWGNQPSKPACEVYHYSFFQYPVLACTVDVQEKRNTFRTWEYKIGIPKESLVRS